MPEKAPGAHDDDEAWAVAALRAEVIRRLLDGESELLRGDKVAAAASELGISRAGLYCLVARYKALDTSSLLPARSGRPKGSRFLDEKREAIIAEEIAFGGNSIIHRTGIVASNAARFVAEIA